MTEHTTRGADLISGARIPVMGSRAALRARLAACTPTYGRLQPVSINGPREAAILTPERVWRAILGEWDTYTRGNHAQVD